MAHTFDNGLPKPQRTIVRTAVVELLQSMTTKRGGFLQSVFPYGGVIRGYTDLDGIDQFVASTQSAIPSIGVACGDASFNSSGTGGVNFTGELELTLFHFNNHPGDLLLGRLAADAAALEVDTRDPGIEVAMAIARDLIVSKRPGVGNDHAGGSIKQIRPRSEEEIVTRTEFTIWAQRYSVMVTANINPNRGITEIVGLWQTRVRTSDQPPVSEGGFVVAGADGGRE